MQIDNHKWQIAVALLAVTCLTGATKQPEGCAPNPLTITLPAVNINDADPLLALAKIAGENRVSLGISGIGNKDRPMYPSPERNIPIRQLLVKMFSDHNLELSGRVVDLIPTNQGPTWLDYKLRKFQTLRASLEFNSMQLFFFLRDQVYHSEGGYAGNVPESVGANKVGPLMLTNISVRDALNTLIDQSSDGGMWVVRHAHSQT